VLFAHCIGYAMKVGVFIAGSDKCITLYHSIPPLFLTVDIKSIIPQHSAPKQLKQQLAQTNNIDKLLRANALTLPQKTI